MITKLNVYIGIKIHCKLSGYMTQNISLFKHEFFCGINIEFRYRKKGRNSHARMKAFSIFCIQLFSDTQKEKLNRK